jgi:hypothetical protein
MGEYRAKGRQDYGESKMATRALFLFCVMLAVPTFGQSKPQLMTQKQLIAYLDQVEAKLPMWDSNLEDLLSPIPVYKGENRDLVALRDSAFSGCRELASGILNSDIPTIIRTERIAPRLGLEIRLRDALSTIHECVSGTLPFIGDARTPGRMETAQKLTQEINPLLLPLLRHILAEADSVDSRRCLSAGDTSK